jgi:hypothetical protein
MIKIQNQGNQNNQLNQRFRQIRVLGFRHWALERKNLCHPLICVISDSDRKVYSLQHSNIFRSPNP